MAQQQEVAFEDWEAEIDEEENKPANNQQEIKQQNTTGQQLPNKAEATNTLELIEQLRQLSDKEFEKKCRDIGTSERVIGQSPALLKTEKDFVELSKNVANRLKKQAEDESDKTVPENHLLLFFEEMLLYLYPKYDWQNLEYAKEKLKIVKKDRREDQTRARKLKEKQERLKRGQRKAQNNQEEPTNDNTQKGPKEIKKQTYTQEQYM